MNIWEMLLKLGLSYLIIAVWLVVMMVVLYFLQTRWDEALIPVIILAVIELALGIIIVLDPDHWKMYLIQIAGLLLIQLAMIGVAETKHGNHDE